MSCNDPNAAPFTSSVVGSMGQDPSTSGWGAKKINLCIYHVMDTIQEGRAAGTGVWSVDGSPQFAPVSRDQLP